MAEVLSKQTVVEALTEHLLRLGVRQEDVTSRQKTRLQVTLETPLVVSTALMRAGAAPLDPVLEVQEQAGARTVLAYALNGWPESTILVDGRGIARFSISATGEVEADNFVATIVETGRLVIDEDSVMSTVRVMKDEAEQLLDSASNAVRKTVDKRRVQQRAGEDPENWIDVEELINRLELERRHFNEAFANCEARWEALAPMPVSIRAPQWSAVATQLQTLRSYNSEVQSATDAADADSQV